MLPVLLAVVALMVLLAVLFPLVRGGRGVPERGQFDRAVYRDQLAELERDVGRGLVSGAEAQAARLEIQRRLLAVDLLPTREIRVSRSPGMAIVIAVAVAGGSIGLYAMLGAPSVPDVPYASRKLDPEVVAGNEHVDMSQAAAKLAERLAQDPSNGEGWLLYARTLAMLNQWDKAANAYRRAIDLGQKGPEVEAGFGEMLVMQSEGIVTPAARLAFESVLKDEPKNDVARYYLALAAGQAGEAQKAIDQLQSLAADIPDDSPMREEIGKRISEAAKAAGLPVPKLAQGKPPEVTSGGPDSDAIAAAAQMPEAERKAMITGMIEKLAIRLQSEPNDSDGWIKLGRAYAVQGDSDKAADAFDRAIKLKPGEVAIPLQAVEAMLSGLQPTDALPPRAITLLRQVEKIAPEQPEVLWYLGVAEARGMHPDDAKRYWAKLLTKLPANGEDYKMVKAAIESLKGG